jgi:hypothetical protein
MKQRIIGKTLAVAVIILFIGLGVQPAFAVDVSTSIADSEDEYIKTNTSIGFGFIVCRTFFVYEVLGRDWYFPLPNFIIICEDLDTGNKRIGYAGLLGLHIFKFLPIGHDYKLSFYFGFINSPLVKEKTIHNFDGYTEIRYYR